MSPGAGANPTRTSPCAPSYEARRVLKDALRHAYQVNAANCTSCYILGTLFSASSPARHVRYRGDPLHRRQLEDRPNELTQDRRSDNASPAGRAA